MKEGRMGEEIMSEHDELTEHCNSSECYVFFFFFPAGFVFPNIILPFE